MKLVGLKFDRVGRVLIYVLCMLVGIGNILKRVDNGGKLLEYNFEFLIIFRFFFIKFIWYLLENIRMSI